MESLSKIILGTVQLGMNYGVNNQQGKPDKQEAFGILELAESSGIKYVDTAAAYGQSIDLLCEFFDSHQSNLKVLSKLTLSSNLNIYDYLSTLAKKLGGNRLEGISLHNQSDLDSLTTYQEDLQRCIDEGIVKKIGVSLYDIEYFDKVIESGIISLVQIQFNILDRSPEKIKALQKLKENNIEVHIRSVYMQGLFFKNPSSFTGPLEGLVPAIDQLQKKFSKEELQALALSYPLSLPYIDHVLIGLETVDQLKENIELLKRSKFTNDFSFLDEIKISNTKLLNPKEWV